MKLKKLAYQLHLWIGMISGIIVFIVCITGAIWALKINGWVDSDKKQVKEISVQNSPLLSPSKLSELSSDSLQGNLPQWITYTKGEAASIRSYGENHSTEILINPYNGEILSVTNNKIDGESSMSFWDYIRWGHRSLWLPWEIGRIIVNYGTLAFVIVLITGLIIWFPKSKKAAKNRLWFNWKKTTPTKRKIFDLHSVLGFYIYFFLLAIAATGMVWGIEWWSNGLYKVTSGGKDLPEWGAIYSDTLSVNNNVSTEAATDFVFEKIIKENPKTYSVMIGVPDPEEKGSVVNATVYPTKGVYYNSDRYSFDRYTLKEIKTDGPYNGKYEGSEFGDKLRRMNYDIHIGSILGTPGRILVFFAALFGASLPLTGFYIFIKRRYKKKKKQQS